MLNLAELLGPENPLVRELLAALRRFLGSERRDMALLKDFLAACPDGFSTGKYTGRPFTLVFESNLASDHEDYWCAECVIPGDLEDESSLPIFLVDAGHRPLSSGVLRFYGLPLEVEEGRTSCTLTQLRTALTRAHVTFRAPGRAPVLGHLKVC